MRCSRMKLRACIVFNQSSLMLWNCTGFSVSPDVSCVVFMRFDLFRWDLWSDVGREILISSYRPLAFATLPQPFLYGGSCHLDISEGGGGGGGRFCVQFFSSYLIALLPTYASFPQFLALCSSFATAFASPPLFAFSAYNATNNKTMTSSNNASVEHALTFEEHEQVGCILGYFVFSITGVNN